MGGTTSTMSLRRLSIPRRTCHFPFWSPFPWWRCVMSLSILLTWQWCPLRRWSSVMLLLWYVTPWSRYFIVQKSKSTLIIWLGRRLDREFWRDSRGLCLFPWPFPLLVRQMEPFSLLEGLLSPIFLLDSFRFQIKILLFQTLLRGKPWRTSLGHFVVCSPKKSDSSTSLDFSRESDDLKKTLHGSFAHVSFHFRLSLHRS